MYILSVHYPKTEGATFDFDYFRSNHLPKVGEACKAFGLGYAALLRGEESLDGGEPAFFATIILSFATEQGARDAAASEGVRALSADISNFTNVTPVMQFDTAVP